MGLRLLFAQFGYLSGNRIARFFFYLLLNKENAGNHNHGGNQCHKGCLFFFIHAASKC